MGSFLCKYATKKVEDIVGQKLVVSKFIEFLDEFSKKRKNAVILHGPPGIGKTCSVYVIANEFGYELVEINADEIRDTQKIESVLGNAINTGSIFGNKKIVSKAWKCFFAFPMFCISFVYFRIYKIEKISLSFFF